MYQEEVQRLAEWSLLNNLTPNTGKTEEMILDSSPHSAQMECMGEFYISLFSYVFNPQLSGSPTKKKNKLYFLRLRRKNKSESLSLHINGVCVCLQISTCALLTNLVCE